MPPKPKDTRKKPKPKPEDEAKNAANATTDPDGEVMRKHMLDEVRRMKAQCEEEERLFNYFQQERERLNYFWIVEKKGLEDKKAVLRNKERETQDLEEKQQIEIKVYKQRVKHLLFQNQDDLHELKEEAEIALKLKEDEHRDVEAETKKDKRSLRVILKERELSHEDYLRSLKKEQDTRITQLRQEFERAARELQLKYEKKMKEVRDEMEQQRKLETQAIEARKNKHISELMKKHEKALAEIKNYYNDITHNNLDLIRQLKEQANEMRKKEHSDEKQMYDIAQENKRLSEPLKKALKDVESLTQELSSYMRDKEELHKTKASILVSEDKLKRLEWEHEVFLQQFNRLQAERDDLYQQLERSIYGIQQKTGLKNLLLEKKVRALEQHVEKKTTQLGEVLLCANLDPAMLGSMSAKLDDVVRTKDSVVKEIQAELGRVRDLHNRMIRHYELKLSEFGIPMEELGFAPLVPS
eukprot:GILI01008353.1.p1 GENE.GILI01008353.1~~GILI01008353.1.p1  ORF type:complete len:469 (-),score=173.89 GILI01008353.1:36-1442(-)